jgi:hypothetical protein
MQRALWGSWPRIPRWNHYLLCRTVSCEPRREYGKQKQGPLMHLKCVNHTRYLYTRSHFEGEIPIDRPCTSFSVDTGELKLLVHLYPDLIYIYIQINKYLCIYIYNHHCLIGCCWNHLVYFGTKNSQEGSTVVLIFFETQVMHVDKPHLSSLFSSCRFWQHQPTGVYYPGSSKPLCLGALAHSRGLGLWVEWGDMSTQD